MVNIYYLFSSITYLQFYIPLVIESSKRGYTNIFILRKNYKEYANPFSKTNLEILSKYMKMYKISYLIYDESNKKKSVDLNEIEGVVFMIDGDIYGPPRKEGLNNSMLFKLNKEKTMRITMTEHMNFWAVYHHFINDVNYAFFSNPNVIDQLHKKNKMGFPMKGEIRLPDGTKIWDSKKSYLHEKNIFIGNTKFDNIPSKEEIFKKYELDPKKKYCLFLFPKIRTSFSKVNIMNMYKCLRKNGYYIIVKTRPKDEDVNPKLRGDKFVCSDIYPNESLELMKVCSLCMISSSSANEEAIFSKIPCIDIISDLRPWERNQYLLDEKVYVRIENNIWKGMNIEKLKSIIDKLEKKDSDYFNHLIEKYLFKHENSAYQYFEFLKNNEIEYL